MTDLYETLGVAKDAAPEQIKKAYRQLAKQHHPDAGGDRDKFHAIALAYDVLSDEARRRKYDETGTIDEGASNPDGPALDLIGREVEMLVQKIVMGDGVEYTDPVEAMRRKLRGEIDKTRGNMREAERFIEKAGKLRKRFSVKSGPDFIGRMLETKIDAAKRAIESGNDQIAVIERALEILADAEFEAEKRPDRVWEPLDYEDAMRAYQQASPFWRTGP